MKQRMRWGMAMAVLTVASGAQAQLSLEKLVPERLKGANGDPGFYFGLGGGVSNFEDTQFSTNVNNSGRPLVCTLPAVGSPPLPCITSTPAVAPFSSPKEFEAVFENGGSYSVGIGYSYKSGFRPEINLHYSEADVESVLLQRGYTGQPNGAGQPGNGTRSTAMSALGKATTAALQTNLWYDWYSDSTLVPYVGGGIGYARVSVEEIGAPAITGGSAALDDNDNIFTWQLGVGVGYIVNPNLMVSLDLRHQGFSDAEFDNPRFGTTVAGTGDLANTTFTEDPSYTAEYKVNSALLTLRYYPKAYALMGGDSDGDGVPDNFDKCPGTPAGVPTDANGCALDSDGDGVPDYLDKCPGTPAGVAVDTSGCALDADGDGIPDAQDKCPESAAGVAVGPDGCALDSDGDGIVDAQDKCPNTPVGVKVSADGCPFDADGDGVPDYLDQCADTPQGMAVGKDGCPLDSDGDGVPDFLDECPRTPAGAKVLANGCALKGDCRTPRPGEQVDANGCALDKAFILKGVNFEYDSDRLTEDAKVILVQVAETLKAYPDVNVEVAGHTDSMGSDPYNLGLSEKRSISVKNFLASQGVNGARLTPNGYGETQPIDSNETEPGRDKNRRVELRVIEE